MSSEQLKIFNSSTLKVTDMNSTNIVLGTAKDNKSGMGKSVAIKYMGKSFNVQTPKMRSPFGLSKFDPSKMQKNSVNPPQSDETQPQDTNKWSISLSFDTDGKPEVVDKISHFKNILNEIDSVLIDKGCDKSASSWAGQGKAGKQLTKDQVETRNTAPSVFPFVDKKQSADGPVYPDTFRVKVSEPINTKGVENTYHTTFFHHSDLKTPLSIDFNNPDAPNYASKVVPPNSYLICIVYASIWSTAANWGVRWGGQQVVVYPSAGGPNLKICAIEVDPEDDDGDCDNGDNGDVLSPVPVVPVANARGTSTVDPPTIDESDDEDYDEVEE